MCVTQLSSACGLTFQNQAYAARKCLTLKYGSAFQHWAFPARKSKDAQHFNGLHFMKGNAGPHIKCLLWLKKKKNLLCPCTKMYFDTL